MAATFNAPGLNAMTDLAFLSAVKISMDVFLFLQSQKPHLSVPFAQAAEALPLSERQAFIQAVVKSLMIVKQNFGKIMESQPESLSVLPQVAATLASMCAVVSDPHFVELAGSLTHSCLQQLANTAAGIERKYVSMCCKSFNKLLGIASCSDSFGVRVCSLLLLQIVLRTISTVARRKLTVTMAVEVAAGTLALRCSVVIENVTPVTWPRQAAEGSCWVPGRVDVDSEKTPTTLPVVLRDKPVSVTLNSEVRVSAEAVVMTIWVLLEVTAGAEPVIAPTLAAPAAMAAVPVKYPVGMLKVIVPPAATTVTRMNTSVTVTAVPNVVVDNMMLVKVGAATMAGAALKVDRDFVCPG